MVTIREATASDAQAIRRLIWRVGINPLGLDWRRFIVAVSEQGVLVGCGQIKPHRDGSRELASIAVQPEWQGQGIGRQVIEHLLARHLQPLYLTCRSSLGSFYQQYGFQHIQVEEMPQYFRFIWHLYALFKRLNPRIEGLLVMRKK